MIVSRSHTLYGNELRKALPSLILNYGGRASQWHSQSETGNEKNEKIDENLLTTNKSGNFKNVQICHPK